MADRASRNGSTPTVLLVHDAFADTGSWAGTVRAGADLGTDLVALPNPLRGLATDGAYVAAAAATVDGPVVLVGHGYGGAVVSVAAGRVDNVVGLVYVAALLPVPSGRIIDLVRGSGHFLAALNPHQCDAGVELYLSRAAYPSVYAHDLPADAAAVAAALQRPVLAAAFEERPDALPDVRSQYLITTADRVLDARLQHDAAARAGATTTEVDASHAVVLSRPGSVVDAIRSALA